MRRAGEAGGNRGTILNAADEVAVEAFLRGAIGFPRIADVIERSIDRWGSDAEPALDEIVSLDAEVRSALAAELGVAA